MSVVTVDFGSEQSEYEAYIRQAVEKAKGGEPIKMITLGYAIGQDNWVEMVFDTRPDAEPDGSWGGETGKFPLERPNWPDYDSLEDEQTLRCVGLKGAVYESPVDEMEDEEIATIAGEVLKAALISCRNEGVFEALSLQDGAEIGIEDLEGGFGWPDYEDRGKENLAIRSS